MSALNAPYPSAAELSVLDDLIEQQRFTRWFTSADGQRVAESTLRLSGMTCAACAGIIEQALGRVDGVRDASVSAAGQRAAVRWDPQRTCPSRLIEAIRRAGYDAAPDDAVSARAQRLAEGRLALWRLFVAALCMMQVMMLAAPSYFSAPGELPADQAQLLNWGSWVLSLPVLLFSAQPFWAGLWHGLRRRRIGMDVPVALGLLVAFVASTGAAFDPDGIFGSEVYFDSLTMFVSFLLGARYLELRARQRAAHALEGALDSLPLHAERERDDGSTERVSVLRLQLGDTLRVAVGQPFPADGPLLEGETIVDEALLSGESSPRSRSVGDQLIAGSLNLGAPVRMRVVRLGADTRHQAIVQLMRDALSQRPALAHTADRWAAPFLWTVLVLAALAALAWSAIDPSRALGVAVAVLVVTCPCALSLAAPSALVAAAGGLARRGVLLQRVDALEALAGADQLFIDKTGTLTTQRLRAQPAQLRQRSALLNDAAQALARAATLARWSAHPLALALVAAQPQPQRSPPDWSAVEERSGSGLAARDANGGIWRLGSAAWVDAPTTDAAEHTQVWLRAPDGGLAVFGFDECLRDGAAAAVVALRDAGLRVTLLSGDTPARAQALARQLQADAVIGGASPQHKLQVLADAQAGGARVIMVGDGVNDAPVLARADVSLAMGQGALVARAHADAVLVDERLADIVHMRSVAQHTMRIVRQNLAWAAAYNAACVPLALAGYLPPWAAGLGMAASSTVVVLNSLRAAR